MTVKYEIHNTWGNKQIERLKKELDQTYSKEGLIELFCSKICDVSHMPNEHIIEFRFAPYYLKD